MESAIEKHHHHSGGKKLLNSRKFWFSAGTSLAIVATGCLAAFKPAMAAVYPELIAGLTGVLTLFITGNLAQKHIVGKQIISGAGGKTPESSPVSENQPEKPQS